MTCKELLSLLPQIASWITILLVLFTFLEMVKQRKSTYKPDIVVSRSVVYAYLDKDLQPSIWLDKHIESDELDIENLQYSGYFLHTYNLGLGAARDIDFKWSINIQNMIKTIDDLQDSHGDSINISFDENERLLIEDNSKIIRWINTKLDLNRSVDYILPTSVERSGCELSFPMSYIDLLSIQLMLCGQRSKNNGDEAIPFPDFQPLKLQIQYRDIGGSKHSKEFQIQPSLLMIKYGDMKKGEQMFSMILNIQ